jgi:hypothetical protein
VRADGERNASFSHLPHDLVQSVCALHMDIVTSVALFALPLRTRNQSEKSAFGYTYNCKSKTTERAVP